jgi:hypothetical protein
MGTGVPRPRELPRHREPPPREPLRDLFFVDYEE